ncbi:Rossmann-like and DUF2520 domain-containing protein [Bergeyella porcorum]|uniref:Rossmann-like and DUF2520 domain-containing protein n=1 Tax=Bergeyella porcorum TaxID=1735111 RepID=UPI0035EFFD4D
MEIIIIGTGNVAYHLTKALIQNKIPVKQIFGRNEKALEMFSQEFQIPSSHERLESAALYIIAVSDASVEEVSRYITQEDCLVAHTSGSLPKEVLQGNYRKASFYPLQTFSKTKDLDYSQIPFFIETESETDFNLLEKLGRSISEKVMAANYEKRKYIHLTAVFSCNFVNHLFSIAKEISDSQQIPFDFFLPLIDETVEKIHHLHPKEAQTGPAVRNDKRVLSLHEVLLADSEYLELYQMLNASIQKMYRLE